MSTVHGQIMCFPLASLHSVQNPSGMQRRSERGQRKRSEKMSTWYVQMFPLSRERHWEFLLFSFLLTSTPSLMSVNDAQGWDESTQHSVTELMVFRGADWLSWGMIYYIYLATTLCGKQNMGNTSTHLWYLLIVLFWIPLWAIHRPSSRENSSICSSFKCKNIPIVYFAWCLLVYSDVRMSKNRDITITLLTFVFALIRSCKLAKMLN